MIMSIIIVLDQAYNIFSIYKACEYMSQLMCQFISAVLQNRSAVFDRLAYRRCLEIQIDIRESYIWTRSESSVSKVQ